VRKLLQDADPSVRLSVALALLNAQDREAVPVLVAGLSEMPMDQAGQALETLYQLAGDKAPEASLEEAAPARKKCRDAWAAWWKANGAKVDLARVNTAETSLGYTLLVEDGQGHGRVREIGRDGKTRWEIDNIAFPVDAHILRGNRVLIAEQNQQRVTERDFKGNILWTAQGLPAPPVNAQRLTNGNTFVATSNGLVEFDRAGKEVWRHMIPGQFISAAYKTRSGEILVLSQQGRLLRMDAKGNTIKSFPSGRFGGWTSGIDVTADGRVLISRPQNNQVAEMDRDGKTLWQTNVPGVITATRLPNGHILIASAVHQNAQELDRNGRVVWQFACDRHLFRARRR
jgi:hypothetical protein